MSARLILIAIVSVLAIPTNFVAADEDLPKTPKAFEERIDVLLGVEQDAKQALALAVRVMKSHGDEQAWAAALLNAGVRAGEAGNRVVALNLLQLITGPKGDVLGSADQARLRSALQRWGQGGVPNTRRLAPLEPIHVASPLETKVRELFAPLTNLTDQKEQNRVKKSIESALIDTGPEILGVLARIASDTPGVVGRVAGGLLASRGGAAARPYLERMLTSGNTLTRGTAVRSLSSLAHPESGTWWEAHGAFIERVTKNATDSEKEYIRHHVLLSQLRNDELWARYQQGGEDARHFLRRLARNGDTRAFKEAIAGIANQALPEADRKTHRLILTNVGSSKGGRLIANLLANVDEATIRALVDMLRVRSSSGFGSQPPVLSALSRWQGDQTTRETIADDVWMDSLRLATRPDTSQNQVNGIASMLRSFASADYMPPRGICENESLCRAFFASLHMIIDSTRIKALFEAQPMLLDRMFDVYPQLGVQERKLLLGRVVTVDGPISKRWGEMLGLPPLGSSSGNKGLLPNVIRQMARAGDPALWPWIKEHVEEAGYPDRLRTVVSALANYPDEQVLAFARRALANAENMDMTMMTHVISLLDYRYVDVEATSDYGAAAIEFLGAVAADPSNRASVLAVRRLIALQQDEKLIPLFAQALAMEGAIPEGWSMALVSAAAQRLLVEGAPFLIEQYRETRNQEIAQVLDKLRAHKERLASFEDWRTNEGKAAAQEFLDQLGSEDAAERRAAILGLAAMREMRAVLPLAKMATKDPDEAVRRTAMAALERLADLGD